MGLLSAILGIFTSKRDSDPEESEEFVDIELALEFAHRNDDGVIVISGLTQAGSSLAGLIVELDPHWNEQPLGESGAFAYWGSGRIRSPGETGNVFVRRLASAYGIPCSSDMAGTVEALVVGLANDPAEALVMPTKMKFFFNSESEEHYAEVFINLDVPAGRLEFHEKDPEYREPLLHALCATS